MTVFKCEACGSTLKVKSGERLVQCQYCGASYSFDELSTKNETATISKRNEKKKELIRSLKFLLISISAGVIQVASFALINFLIKSDEEYGVSYFISLMLSVLWNFTINRKFTFQSASNITVAMLLVAGFYAVFTPLSIWWGVALEKAGWDDFLILALTMIANFILEFLFTRYVVYKNTVDTNERAKAQAQKHGNLEESATEEN